jgi:hypothetical protein
MVVVTMAAGLVIAGSTPAPALSIGDEADWTLGGVPCTLIPVQPTLDLAEPLPFGTGTCPGVRPGAFVGSDIGGCTFNFMFTDGANTYMGTAGHCILPSDGERTWAYGSGPVATDGDGNRVGEFVYAVLEDPRDFSVIRLDAGVAADPAMCHFGGPTGINNDLTADPVELHHFGQGLGLGETVPARTHLALSMPNPDHVYANGAAIFGDSGSGVISDDGRAVGVLVTIGLHLAQIGTEGNDVGTVGITRLGPQLARASQMLGTTLTLVPAPLAP